MLFEVLAVVGVGGVEVGHASLGGGDGVREALEQGWANFSVKGQIGNILELCGPCDPCHSIPLCRCGGKKLWTNAMNGMAVFQ